MELISRAAAATLLLFVWPPSGRGAQEGRIGLEVAGLPAVNFYADEGFRYGALAQLLHYGNGGRAPCLWTLQPTAFLTTRGRRDFTVFFDSPHLLSGGWRLDAYLASEEQVATPYQGLGDDSSHEPALKTDRDPYYYRFGGSAGASP